MLLLRLLLRIAAASADPQHLLLVIAPQGSDGWAVLQLHPTDLHGSASSGGCIAYGRGHDSCSVVTALGTRGEPLTTHRVMDARLAAGCGVAGRQASGAVSLVVPASTARIAVAGKYSTVHVDLPPAPPTSVYTQRRRRRAATTDTAPSWASVTENVGDGIEVAEVQRAGYADRHLSFVFLSGGYLQADKQQFWSDVDRAVEAMRAREPLSRYASLFNVFAVFQASLERGAARPDLGTTSQNNLDCSYGEVEVRRLYCSHEKALALAHTSESADVVVSLVNSAEYGGTGSGTGVCTVYNGDKMPVVLAHELGHALGGLGDEYTYGFTEGKEVSLPNCWSGRGESPWAWEATQHEHVVKEGIGGCGYDNYRRPTDDGCLMKSNIPPGFCPVCTRALVEAIYRKDGTDIAYPRCPVEYETVHVLVNESVRLYGNPALTGVSDFDVVWAVDGGAEIKDGEQGSCPGVAACFLFKASDHAVGQHEVRLVVRDRTSWAPTLPPASTATSVFRVVVATSLPTESETRVCSHRHSAEPYRSVCDAGKNCTLRMAAHAYEAVQDYRKQIREWFIGMGVTGVVVLALTVGIIYLLWQLIATWLENVEGVHIVPLTRCQNGSLRFLLGQCVVWVLLAMILMGVVAAVNHNARASLPDDIFVPILAGLGGFWLLELMIYSFTATKSKPALALAGVLLGLLFVAVAALLGVALSLVHDVGGNADSVRSRLRNAWEDAVGSHPSLICTVQRNLECSGWDRGCDSIPGRSSQCPGKCEISNQFPEPCYSKVYDWLETQFPIYTSCLALTTLVFAASMVLAVHLACTLVLIKRSAGRPRGRRRSLPRARDAEMGEVQWAATEPGAMQLAPQPRAAAPSPSSDQLLAAQASEVRSSSPEPSERDTGSGRRLAGQAAAAPGYPAPAPNGGDPEAVPGDRAGSAAAPPCSNTSSSGEQRPAAEVCGAVVVRKDELAEPLGLAFTDASDGHFVVSTVSEGSAAWRSGCTAAIGKTLTHICDEPVRDVNHIAAVAAGRLQVTLRFAG